MDEDILSDVVPSNIVSRQASQKRSNQLVGANSHSFQPSQGADGESEFDDEPMEEDELISDTEDVPVRAVAAILASLS
jgi:SWI/SNF-related matrix-associated actin-dependent regulator of chromatin subfamily A member 5